MPPSTVEKGKNRMDSFTVWASIVMAILLGTAVLRFLIAYNDLQEKRRGRKEHETRAR